MKVYVSGKWVDEAEASISVFDHGLLYGDGVFEGIRIYNKRIFLLEEHIDRLFDSAQAIALEIPLILQTAYFRTLESSHAICIFN